MFLSAQLRKRAGINKNKPGISVLLYASMKLDRVLTDLLRKKKLITHIHFNTATEMLEYPPKPFPNYRKHIVTVWQIAESYTSMLLN